MIWKLVHPNITAELLQFYSVVLKSGALKGETRQKKVHLQFCKFVLGVGQNAHQAAVSGECAQIPLSIQYQKR